MRGNTIKKRLTSFAFEKTPRVSLGCKLVPVQYREYENSLLDYELEISINYDAKKSKANIFLS